MLCWQDSDHTDIFMNQGLNNTITLRPLIPHIMPCYMPQNGGSIVAVYLVTLFHPIYSQLAHPATASRHGGMFCLLLFLF